MTTTLTSFNFMPAGYPGFLEHIVKQGLSAGYLDSAFFSSFQAQLWQMMETLSLKFTSGDSSSLPRQTAEELVQSVYYTLGAALHHPLPTDSSAVLKQSCERLRTTSLSRLWEEGQEALGQQMHRGRQLLATVKKRRPPAPSISYNDTLLELERFFLHYDQGLMSCQTPCMIDYQLAVAVPDDSDSSKGLSGIQFINEYLLSLLTENRFLSAFPPATVESLLASCYGSDFRELISNLFEPVFLNACGLTMLNRDFTELHMSAQDKQEFLFLLSQNEPKQPPQPNEQESAQDKLKAEVSKAVIKLCRQLDMIDSFSLSYFKSCGSSLVQRLKWNSSPSGLDGIFTSITERKAPAAPVMSYEGFAPMDDEMLRELIEEIRRCRYLSDKMALIRDQVKSLEDLAEILEYALFSKEHSHFLSTMKDFELAALHQVAADRTGLESAALLTKKETGAFPEWISALLSQKSRYGYLITMGRSQFPGS